MNIPTHIAYIDESGIHKFTEHSVFVLLYVDTHNDTFINSRIEEIEKDLGISYFHWADFGSKKGWNIRKAFIQQISVLPFTFKYILLNNPIKPQQELQSFVLDSWEGYGLEKIYIDGKKPKWYERQFKKALRDKGVSIQSLKTVHDQSVPAIRLADALAGLVRSYHDKPYGVVKKLYKQLHPKQNHSPLNEASGQGYR